MSAPHEEVRTELLPELDVRDVLGSGSVARVFLASEPALGRFVAVKVLRAEFALDPVARQRFEREARAAASIRHPNVTAIHRVGRLSDDLPYIVMELVRGRTLEDLLQVHGSLEPSRAIGILTSLAEALASAHRAGIVHRDLRPANVMLEEETGRVVLMDFGIAALLETPAGTAARITTAGTMLGDPSHISPEQFEGERVTGQSDVYALGVTGYELLTGSGPFGPKVPVTAARTLQGEEAPEVGIVGAPVPPRVSLLLRRCLALKPEHRPTAAEIAHALDAVRLAPDAVRSMRPDRPYLRAPTPTPTDPAGLASDASGGWSGRHLAAVWFADLVGYSALAASDERAALLEVRLFQQVCRAEVDRCGGRVVKFIGDGAFAEFASTEAAVQAASRVAAQLAAPREDGRAAMLLRIGVHVADVTAADDGDLLGDGINVASRLEREARPGEILVSGDVRRQLRSRRHFVFRSLGTRELPGIGDPVEVYALETRPPGDG